MSGGIKETIDLSLTQSYLLWYVIFDRQYFLKTAKFHMDINAFICQSPNYFDTTCVPIEKLFPLHLNSQKCFSES